MTGDQQETSKNQAGEATGASVTRHVTVVGNRIESRDLFVDTRDVLIGHGRDTYHLRITAQNKLILTK